MFLNEICNETAFLLILGMAALFGVCAIGAWIGDKIDSFMRDKGRRDA